MAVHVAVPGKLYFEYPCTEVFIFLLIGGCSQRKEFAPTWEQILSLKSAPNPLPPLLLYRGNT